MKRKRQQASLSLALLPHFIFLGEARILSDPLHTRNDFLPMSLCVEGI
ncbi:hypothetical protein RR42_m0942 [Cupriavidus basilensis]|uniref:Uncharacterized protein n=1 Tax=Cupriavidus basilensis TaxID=68895 RepID=A0A0C4Y611_9BURK|nr:hypothetical protein RR42_m0942 [Cupriavidus basilensis]